MGVHRAGGLWSCCWEKLRGFFFILLFSRLAECLPASQSPRSEALHASATLFTSWAFLLFSFFPVSPPMLCSLFPPLTRPCGEVAHRDLADRLLLGPVRGSLLFSRQTLSSLHSLLAFTVYNSNQLNPSS